MIKRIKSIYNKYWPVLGILVPILYIGADSYTASQYSGYNYTDQAISELSAIGSPTQQLWQILTLPFSPLLILFGLSMFFKIPHPKSIKITGLLLFLWGISGYLWLLVPMNMRGNIGSASDTGHLIMSALTVFIITMIIAVGSGTFGKWFRFYSIATIVIMLVFGFMVGRQAANVAAQLPTPNMGLLERVCVFLPMIWVSSLSVGLLSMSSPRKLKNK